MEVSMKSVVIPVAIVVALIAWQPSAAAQSTGITTDYLMTLFAPLERFPIDNSTVIVNVKAGGWVKGPRINGRIIPPGGDWLRIMPSGVARLDVRLLIETDDGALIHMTYGGVFVTAEEVRDALARGEVVTDKSVPYFVTAPTFQTSSERYAWLNNVQAVGKMIELKRGEDAYIKYDVFVVR
jgi:hypothetical protein